MTLQNERFGNIQGDIQLGSDRHSGFQPDSGLFRTDRENLGFFSESILQGIPAGFRVSSSLLFIAGRELSGSVGRNSIASGDESKGDFLIIGIIHLG
jgi:hypothetical protein